MIESFSVKNFKSIKELITIDFTNKEKKNSKDQEELFKTYGDTSISRLNFFYGKNGAGKSSIVDALKAFWAIVFFEGDYLEAKAKVSFKYRARFPFQYEIIPFKIVDSVEYETFFSMIFNTKNNKYRYSIIFDSRKTHILDESLEYYNESFITLFSKSESTFLNLTEVEKERLKTYRLDRRSILNLFNSEIQLSNIMLKKHVENARKFFFDMSFSFFSINNDESLSVLSKNPKYVNDIKEQVKKFDLSVDDISIDVKSISFDEYKKRFSNSFENDDSKEILEYIKESYEYDKIEYNLNIIHKKKKLGFSEESSGTRSITNILFSLYTSNKKVWIIDDFEKDLHTEASIQIVKFLAKHFLNLQIIFITHELEFLNLQEVHHKALHYFVERDDKDLSTRVVNLSQFSDLRNDDRNSWEQFYKKFRLAQYPKITFND